MDLALCIHNKELYIAGNGIMEFFKDGENFISLTKIKQFNIMGNFMKDFLMVQEQYFMKMENSLEMSTMELQKDKEHIKKTKIYIQVHGYIINYV